MKWENLINLKIGDKVKYKLLRKSSIEESIIIRIGNCYSFKNGICKSINSSYRGKRCIGKIIIKKGYKRCGVEDGWSLIDPELEDFFDEKEFEI